MIDTITCNCIDDKKNHSSEYETSFGKETPQHPRQSILLSGSGI